jgi:predicted secreted protein
MSLTTALAIYFLIWWITLFAVLPWGVRAQDESAMAPGTDPGAPAIPRLLLKLIATTLVAAIIFAGCYVVYTRRIVTLDGLAAWFGLPN